MPSYDSKSRRHGLWLVVYACLLFTACAATALSSNLAAGPLELLPMAIAVFTAATLGGLWMNYGSGEFSFRVFVSLVFLACCLRPLTNNIFSCALLLR